MPGHEPAAQSHEGPWFEDLDVGVEFSNVPALTLTDGHAAVHQSILGDRLRLPLDAALSRAVLGADRALAHPALAWDVAIGQSTVATGRVIANLFYRDLVFLRPVLIGDTLHTRTRVEALRQTSHRPETGSRGLALLHMVTRDQEDRVVLDFRRCAMLPLSDPHTDTGRQDSVEAAAPREGAAVLAQSVGDWQLAPLRAACGGPAFADLQAGMIWRLGGGDVVSSAPELARLTLNIAGAHHDRFRDGGDGRRLVYGGHAVGLAAARAARALPTLATICAWHSCDHLGPVFEDDTLYTEIELEDLEPLSSGGGLAHLRAGVQARSGAARDDTHERRDVLEWKFAALVA
jgi:acyl dehydratase